MALKRELGPISVFAVGAGAMISSGVFVLPAIAFAVVGPGVYLCFLLAAVLLVPTVLSKAELMTAMPKAGGTYYYIDRSLGPGFGTVGGLAAWASLAFKSAFALLGIGIASTVGLEKITGIPLQLPVFFLSLLLGAIQALVFTLLASIYFMMMLPHEHEEGEAH